MAVTMASQFSEDGKYFGQISTEGKLKIWSTVSNTLEQEFTPDFHLTTPCTCLQFLQEDTSSYSGATPRKKKRRTSVTISNPSIALGTTSGLLLVYSISKASVDYTINSETNHAVTCLTTDHNGTVYSGADQNIFIWNLQKKTVNSKWKGGNEKITAVLVVPDKKLVTASKSIKLWDVDTKQVLRTFTGHSSDVVFLQYIKPRDNNDAYFVSGSKGDRLLSCWNLSQTSKEKNAVASFLMEDIVQNLSVIITSDGCTKMAATVRSGIVHIFQHTLNGKCTKPLKPQTTIQVVSDSGQSNDLVAPIQIVGATYRDPKTLCIGHGTDIILTFENLDISTYQKHECLVRKDPRTIAQTKAQQASKLRPPIIGNDVNYLTPQTSNAVPTKRKVDGQMEVPMEQRLENLTLNKTDSKIPRADNVAQLLIQGLHSKDKHILRTVLSKRDENVIRNTVKRLPITVFVPLLQELTGFVQGKTLSSQIGVMWLRHILQVHAGLLLSNPELPELLGPALGSIESKLTLQAPINRLRGRLDLLVAQVSPKAAQESSENEDPLLVYNDKDSSDSDQDDMELIEDHSESENEWDEEEYFEEGGGDAEVDEDNDDDVNSEAESAEVESS